MDDDYVYVYELQQGCQFTNYDSYFANYEWTCAV